jgi:hypothetical protein
MASKHVCPFRIFRQAALVHPNVVQDLSLEAGGQVQVAEQEQLCPVGLADRGPEDLDHERMNFKRHQSLIVVFSGHFCLRVV